MSVNIQSKKKTQNLNLNYLIVILSATPDKLKYTTPKMNSSTNKKKTPVYNKDRYFDNYRKAVTEPRNKSNYDKKKYKYNYDCPFCSGMFSFNEMYYHFSKSYYGYGCPTCSFATDLKYKYNIHVNFHGEKIPLVCPVCFLKSETEKELVAHMTDHLGYIQEMCDNCKYYAPPEYTYYPESDKSGVPDNIMIFLYKQFENFMYNNTVKFNQKQSRWNSGGKRNKWHNRKSNSRALFTSQSLINISEAVNTEECYFKSNQEEPYNNYQNFDERPNEDFGFDYIIEDTQVPDVNGGEQRETDEQFDVSGRTENKTEEYFKLASSIKETKTNEMDPFEEQMDECQQLIVEGIKKIIDGDDEVYDNQKRNLRNHEIVSSKDEFDSLCSNFTILQIGDNDDDSIIPMELREELKERNQMIEQTAKEVYYQKTKEDDLEECGKIIIESIEKLLQDDLCLDELKDNSDE